MMQRRLRAALAAAAAAAVALAACGGTDITDDKPQRGYRTNAFGESHAGDIGTHAYGSHDNRKLTRGGALAQALENIDGIARAEVVVGETNAYVGVVLDERAKESPLLGGSSARSSAGPEEYGMRGNYYGATDSRVFPAPGRGARNLSETGTSAGARKMYGLEGGRGGIGGVTMRRSGTPAAGAWGSGGPAGASSIADIGGAPPPPGTNPRLTAQGLSQQVRARVEAVVRASEPNIRNVYVSAAPGVVEGLGRTKLRGGGAVRQFNEWAPRFFGKDDANRYDMHR